MKIGDVIHLIGQLEDETKYNYRCKIVDMTKNALYIDYPVDIGTSRTVFIPVGESFHVRLIKETAVYQFESKVIEYTKRIIPVLKIAVPKKEAFEKIQRRTHLRVKTVVDVAIHCPNDTFPPFTTITKDISGGGARLVIPSTLNIKLERKQTILLYLVLKFSSEKYEYIETVAEIIRLLKNKTSNEISVSFLNLDANIEQQLVQYCFLIERRTRRQDL